MRSVGCGVHMELGLEDACVEAGRGHQLGVGSHRFDLALVQHHDQIRVRERRQAVRAQDDGHAVPAARGGAEGPLQGRDDAGLGRDIDG